MPYTDIPTSDAVTGRLSRYVTEPPFMQTQWAAGKRVYPIVAYTLWAAWCVMWAVLWIGAGPLAVVLTPLSLAALAIPFRPRARRVIGGYVIAEHKP
jgi:hypothetical protein